MQNVMVWTPSDVIAAIGLLLIFLFFFGFMLMAKLIDFAKGFKNPFVDWEDE